jgi:periplasmic protein TonB
LSASLPVSSVADRFGSTLFLAALAHGVLILGVTFTATPLESNSVMPSLNVTLLVDDATRQAPPDHSDFIANANQQGSGDVPHGERPTAAPSSDQPFPLDGSPRAADFADGAPRDPARSAEQLVTRSQSERRLAAVPRATEDPAPVPMRAAALLANVAPLTLATEVDLVTEQPATESRELLVTPSTRESSLAPYLDGWRRRVEGIGTANFPEQFRGRNGAGRPTLEVAIDRNGRLEEIVVRQSSGDTALDQAALTILRLAAPFEALPEEIRARYDVLRFAYEWDFFGGVSTPH